MKTETLSLNMLTFCYAFFSLAVYVPVTEMSVYDWIFLTGFYTVIYIVLSLFVIHGQQQTPLGYLILILYLMALFAKQISSMYDYIKLFHGHRSGMAVVIISLLSLLILVFNKGNITKLAAPCFVMTAVLILFLLVLNAEKISAANLYQVQKIGRTKYNATLFDYIIPYGIIANDIKNYNKKKVVKYIILSDFMLLMIVLLAFSCLSGDLLYSISPLQMLFQISTTELIKNFDALFNFLLFFGYFSAITVLTMAYRTVKEHFPYFNYSDLLLIIPLFLLYDKIGYGIMFLLEIIVSAIMFTARRKGESI